MAEVAPIGKRRRLNRVAAACDFCKKRKVKCDGEQPCAYCKQKGCADTCSISGSKSPSVKTTSFNRNTNSTTRSRRKRMSSEEGNTYRSRSCGGLNQNHNHAQLGSSLSPATRNDDRHEDTIVPLEGRIHHDAQGKFIFIGDCAPLSFLQTVRYLISAEIDPDGFSVPATRDCIIEIARSTTADRPMDTSVNLQGVIPLVNKYLVATSGIVELFKPEELMRELKAWASGVKLHSEDAAAAVFFLVLAIGAQETDEVKAEAWFEHAKEVLSKNICSSMNVAAVQGFTLVAVYLLRAFQPNGAYLYFCEPLRFVLPRPH